MPEVNRGEIWQFSFPAPDRRRPVLVLTRQEGVGHLHLDNLATVPKAAVRSFVGTVSPQILSA
jgi:mRNA-degrading endonuclease toxin of MazEF toxin-antitoxin module